MNNNDFVEQKTEKPRESVWQAKAKKKFQPIMFTKFGPLAIASPFVTLGIILYLGNKFVPSGEWWVVLFSCTAFIVFMFMWHNFIAKNPLLEKGIFVTILPYVVGGLVLIGGILLYPQDA